MHLHHSIKDNRPAMLTGKRFLLKATTLGIETIGTQRDAVQIPPGETVTVVSGPTSDDSRMLDVLWNGRSIVMFVDDIQTRAREIDGHT